MARKSRREKHQRQQKSEQLALLEETLTDAMLTTLQAAERHGRIEGMLVLGSLTALGSGLFYLSSTPNFVDYSFALGTTLLGVAVGMSQGASTAQREIIRIMQRKHPSYAAALSAYQSQRD